MKRRTKLRLLCGSSSNDNGPRPCASTKFLAKCYSLICHHIYSNFYLSHAQSSPLPATTTTSITSLKSHLLIPLSLIILASSAAIATAESNSASSWLPNPLTSSNPWPFAANTSSIPPNVESFSDPHHVPSSQTSSTVNTPNHSNANHRDEAQQETTNHNSQPDPINRAPQQQQPSSPSASKRQKSLPNQSRRQSKLGEEFPLPLPQGATATEGPAEARNEQQQPTPQHTNAHQAKPKGPSNPPSSMDDIIGGLLTLMGGNMKIPGGGQQQQQSNGNSASDKLASLLANLGGAPKQRPPHGSAQLGSLQRPPIPPPFGPVPNLNIAKLQNLPPGMGQGPGGQFHMPPGGPAKQFPMYQNFPFIPLLPSNSPGGGRTPIPLGGAAGGGGGGGNFHKLPPNFPPINGMTKAEMDALYAQFMANGGAGPDKSALINNLLKLAANKPLPPGIQLPPGLFPQSKHPVPPSRTPESAESSVSTSSIISPTPSLDHTMHPMTEPLQGSKVHQTNSVLLEEPPQIITMPEGPSTFEMVVRQQLGPSVHASNSATVLSIASSVEPSTTLQQIRPSKPLESTRATVNFQTNPQDVVIQEIRNQHGNQHSSMLPKEANSKPKTTDIVYGKRIAKPTSSSNPQGSGPVSAAQPPVPSTLMPSFSSSNMAPTRTANEFSPSLTQVPTPTSTVVGKPMVVPVEVDEGVRPRVGPGRTSSPAAMMPTASMVDPTRTLDATRAIASKTAGYHQSSGKSTVSQGSAQPIPKSSTKPNNRDLSSSGASAPSAKPVHRRPQFRPRPNVPIVRIDTCIVGDDSTCDTSLNEKCLTELGLSSCQCRPGFARIQPRTLCIPVISLSLSFRVDRMNDKKVQFTRPLLNPNSEEYQYLEYESLLALNSMFSATKTLAPELMGVKVNRFYSVGGRTIVNATVNLRAESNETTAGIMVSPNSIKRTLQQELTQVIASTQNQLGESQLWVDSNSNAITRIDDLNECSNAETNDCSKHARCYNEFGTFRCECEQGYEDKYADDKHRAGRHCASCSPSYCSNHGECMIIRGERVCKCRANYIGSTCDIDAEVLAVAVGGTIAAIIVVVITFICLYMWNQRFKQEQQKIEAMSAASGHTFSYVNKHGPPTMSRMSIDERYGRSWATHYSDSQQHLLTSSSGSGNSSQNANGYYGVTSSEHHQVSGQPVYATPVRVMQNAGNSSSVNHDYDHHQIPYPDYGTSVRSGVRSLKVKQPQSQAGTTRQSNLTNSHHGLHYPSYAMKLAPDSYNETEFSTRELIYSPAHLYATNPRTSHGFYS